MKVISVVNFKGGVGKTTITANLAAGLAKLGKRVLALDIDPQCSLTFSFITVEAWISEYQAQRNLKAWFESLLYQDSPSSLQSVIVPSHNSKKIKFVYSHLALADTELALSMGLASSSPLQYEYNYLKVHSYLKRAFSEPEIQSEYDVALIDCPPSFGLLTRNAYFASDYYIIPAKMDELSTYGIDSLFKHIEKQDKTYGAAAQKFKRDFQAPDFLGVVPTMLSISKDEPIAVQASQISILQARQVSVFKSWIRESKDLYGKAAELRAPAILYKASDLTKKRAIQELSDLTLEVAAKAGL